MFFGDLFVLPQHSYSFACTGIKKIHDRIFPTREAANEYMRSICRKFGLQIEEVYDDKHYKTYKCSNGVRFFIQRM